MLCDLTVKVGTVEKTSRTTVPNAEHLVDWPEETSLETLVERVRGNVEQAVSRYQPRTQRQDQSVYLRPSSTATQKEFVALTADNLADSIATAQANHARRKKRTGPFIMELFVFVVKEQVIMAGIRRATRSRVVEATEAVDGFLSANPDVQLGEIARTHLVMTHARQPDATPVALPDTATFRQMQHIDANRRAGSDPQDGASDFRTLSVKINGSSELQLTIDVRELRTALGLPNYNFLAEGVYNAFVMPPAPAEDIDDVDHMSDSDGN